MTTQVQPIATFEAEMTLICSKTALAYHTDS